MTSALEILFVGDAMALANRSSMLKDAWWLAWCADVTAEYVPLRSSMQYTGSIIGLWDLLSQIHIAHASLFVVLAREVRIKNRLKDAAFELADVADSLLWRDITMSKHMSLLNLLSVIRILLEGRTWCSKLCFCILEQWLLALEHLEKDAWGAPFLWSLRIFSWILRLWFGYRHLLKIFLFHHRLVCGLLLSDRCRRCNL